MLSLEAILTLYRRLRHWDVLYRGRGHCGAFCGLNFYLSNRSSEAILTYPSRNIRSGLGWDWHYNCRLIFGSWLRGAQLSFTFYEILGFPWWHWTVSTFGCDLWARAGRRRVSRAESLCAVTMATPTSDRKFPVLYQQIITFQYLGSRSRNIFNRKTDVFYDYNYLRPIVALFSGVSGTGFDKYDEYRNKGKRP